VAESFMSDFKRSFLRGLAAVLPTMITLMIIVSIFGFVDNYVGRYMNRGVMWVVVQYRCIATDVALKLKGPEAVWDTVKGYWLNYHLSWIGFVLAIMAIYVLGRFVASFLGRSIWRTFERTFFRLPVVKQIYPYVKQVTDFLLSERRVKFSRVVAVEYPRKGVWSLGLVTGPGMKTLSNSTGGGLLTVFIPSSPTPVTGYTIIVRREEVIDLPISIDQALMYTVSGGVVMPLAEQLSAAETEQARQGMFPPPQQKELNSE